MADARLIDLGPEIGVSLSLATLAAIASVRAARSTGGTYRIAIEMTDGLKVVSGYPLGDKDRAEAVRLMVQEKINGVIEQPESSPGVDDRPDDWRGLLIDALDISEDNWVFLDRAGIHTLGQLDLARGEGFEGPAIRGIYDPSSEREIIRALDAFLAGYRQR